MYSARKLLFSTLILGSIFSDNVVFTWIINIMCCVALRHVTLYCIIIRLEDRLQPNIGFTLRRVLDVFTRSDNSAESEPIWMISGALCLHCRGWPWLISGAIRAVATAGEPGEILFFFGQVSNARFHRLPVGQISQNLNTARRDENFRNRILTTLP